MGPAWRSCAFGPDRPAHRSHAPPVPAWVRTGPLQRTLLHAPACSETAFAPLRVRRDAPTGHCPGTLGTGSQPHCHVTDSPTDPFKLSRFLREQDREYAQALGELRAGRKRTHWIWYVLPQLRGLGSSEMSDCYGLSGLEEARAYLAHPVLGARLVECIEAIGAHRESSAAAILGSLDALKYQSCLTLFEAASDGHPVFANALQLHFAGQRDPRTLERVGAA